MSSARSGTASTSISSGPCSSEAASGIAPLPYLSEALGGPPAVLGFRSDRHAQAAELVPNAQACVDPVLVTQLIPEGMDVLACGPESMLEAVRTVAADRPVWPGRRRWPAATGPATAARWRSTVCAQAPVRRRSGCSVLLNASGCLDALTAADVARGLDAFVTKNRHAPLPRDGTNTPVRIAETDVGNAQLDRAGESRHRPPLSLRATSSNYGELGVAGVGVGRRGSRPTTTAEICSRLDDHAEVSAIELTCPARNVDAPAESGHSDRQRFTSRDAEAVVGEALHRQCPTLRKSRGSPHRPQAPTASRS